MENGVKYGIVMTPQAYLYTDDLTEIADEVLMGWAVIVLPEQKKRDGVVYCRVTTHYGYSGFMRADLVRETDEKEVAERDCDAGIFIVRRAFADFLSQPRVQGNILLTVSRGSFVKLISDAGNGYCLAEATDGTRGYIPLVALEKRTDRDGYLYDTEKKGYFLNQHIPEAVSEENFRENVTMTAKSYLGTQYRWGGKSAAGIDCSGLTFMSYMLNGVLIYRDAQIHPEYAVHEISMEQIKKGDLLYFKGHIAMYLGNQMYIHCTGHQNSFGCVINSLNPDHPDYRQDLAEKILAVGSIF